MRWKGSYTVEAAFVIPIVLGVVFVLLYALFGCMISVFCRQIYRTD